MNESRSDTDKALSSPTAPSTPEAGGTAQAAAAPARVHPAFEWLRSETIPSLKVTVEEYRHRRTGAQHLHIASDNRENVFLVALRTMPMDSTGVAHILEHTVLCGSERYPVRDPFFMMIRRSLNTFMNAFTSSDWTAYPFASQNRKDFFNLMDVYLDAVFFARLEELDFRQEGHRLEFARRDDPDSELVFKGVVYNEMKGAMSAPVNQLWQYLSSHVFPTTTYHYNSGGDPQHIPDLSYEALLDFYRCHYHPSNAIFMTYGDIPAADLQARFEERALHRFQASDARFGVPDERRYGAPQQAVEYYAVPPGEDPENKTHVVLGWLLGRNIELDTLLECHLLSSVLLEHGASPLRHALETTDLGAAPSPLCGLEDSNREMTFMCGLEGCQTENAEAVERLVLEVLEKVAREGVPREHLEAALHQLELSQREITGDGFPYGLQLILGALPAAVHRGDPVALLNLDPALERLRRRIEESEFLQRLVRRWLLDNPHRVHLSMVPDPELDRRRAAAEAERLAAIKAGLSEAEKRRIIEQAVQLEARQQQQDDPEILPKVGLEDIPPRQQLPEGSRLEAAGLPLDFFAQGTNGLVYQQIVLELPDLEGELLDLLPYYTRCLPELGCGERDYLAMQAWQSAVSGGVQGYTAVRGTLDAVTAMRGYFVLSSKALVRNHAQLCRLLRDTLERVCFDEHDRIREIIAQERVRREQSLTGRGHSLAMTAAGAGLNPAAALAHRLRGLAGIQHLKRLDETLQQSERVAELARKLEALHRRILDAPRRFLLIGEEQHREQLIAELEAAWRDREVAAAQGTFHPFQPPADTAPRHQLWTTNTQVNFCAKAYPTVPPAHPDAPALDVLAGFLRNGFLHRAVREQGGAYGGGSSHDADLAVFRFFSYRDPRLEETLEDFDRAIDWLLEEPHTWREVEEAILGVIGTIDKPGSPAGEAKDVFHNTLFGRTPEQRQAYRQRILAVTLDDLLRVGREYLGNRQAALAVITAPENRERLQLPDLQVFEV